MTSKPRQARARMTRERILDAAMVLVEGGDAHGLTFRTLTAALGTDATVIYRHFKDKDELERCLVDRLLAEAMDGYTPSSDWKANVRDLAARLRSMHKSHPLLGQAVAARTARQQHEFEGVESWLQVFLLAGAKPAEAAVYYRTVTEFVLAYCLQDAVFDTLDPEIRRADLKSWKVEYSMLDSDAYPAISECLPHIPLVGDSAIFELGLELLIESIAGRLAR